MFVGRNPSKKGPGARSVGQSFYKALVVGSIPTWTIPIHVIVSEYHNKNNNATVVPTLAIRPAV